MQPTSTFPFAPTGLVAMSMPHAGVSAVRLVREVARFELHPEQGLHPSWLPAAWPVRHRHTALRGEAGRAALGTLLHAQAAADPRPVVERFDFDPPLRRLLLLDAASLRRLAAWCGFAVHRGLFRQRGVSAVFKRQARRYGADLPQFVLDRLPPLSQFAMNTARIEARPSSAGAAVVLRGQRLLLGLLAAEGAVLLARAQRMLPRRVSQLPPPVLLPTQRGQLAELILLSLVPERLPQWDWLF